MKKFFKALFSPIVAVLDFVQKYFKALLFFVIVGLIFGSFQGEALKKPNLAKVELSGAIVDSKDIVKRIEELIEKKNIKGVLFLVNSPGGSVAPSIEISRAIKRLKRRKPVVTYAAGTLASGSYYASIWSDSIIANPGSLVGSIGVIFEAPNFKELLNKIGVSTQVVKAGKYKEVGTPFREWREFEREELEKVIQDTYNLFVEDVAEARGLKLEEKEKWAEAHIFTARQAKKVGLIDEVGTIAQAKTMLMHLSKVEKAIWEKEDKFEKFLEKLANETSSKIVSFLFSLQAR
ncbi:MAG: signal peptide peptidase SppA [Epsilonproteobacteria bacterium]|nr:signal peptide peptidase SppA [Campylobacterota bacterium]